MAILRAAIIFMLAMTSAAHADELGPPVGTTIPHDLSAETAGGEAVNFAGLVGEKGLALFFIRSVDWCPFCRAQAVDVNKRVADFEARGLTVAFVSYDPPAKQKPFVEKWKFRPALISDEEIEIINAFGLRNEAHGEGGKFYGIPHPAVFIITPDRKIAAKLYEEDYATNDKSYRNRPAIDVILETADRALAE